VFIRAGKKEPKKATNAGNTTSRHWRDWIVP
jgi:hypothetical protein